MPIFMFGKKYAEKTLFQTKYYSFVYTLYIHLTEVIEFTTFASVYTKIKIMNKKKNDVIVVRISKESKVEIEDFYAKTTTPLFLASNLFQRFYWEKHQCI